MLIVTSLQDYLKSFDLCILYRQTYLGSQIIISNWLSNMKCGQREVNITENMKLRKKGYEEGTSER